VLKLSQAVCPELQEFESLASTNGFLASQDLASLRDFSAVVSLSQTAGQGRLGRSWVSEPGASISLSLLLKAEATPAELSWLTLMAAASVRATVSGLTNSSALIKWPNDVLVNERKISGILAELTPHGVILGIGVNLRRQSTAPEHAISLEELASKASFDEVLAALLTQLRARYLKFLTSPAWAIKDLQSEIRQFSASIGQRVRAIYPDQRELTGIAVDIDSNGNLLIEADGIHAVSAADIIHLRN
jgi:BirA family transcriptional regulator, biotin operon repressor / biotin---[acetyl-CoA-carboxylase] ligase